MMDIDGLLKSVDCERAEMTCKRTLIQYAFAVMEIFAARKFCSKNSNCVPVHYNLSFLYLYMTHWQCTTMRYEAHSTSWK